VAGTLMLKVSMIMAAALPDAALGHKSLPLIKIV
jgi:hypothetical protein